MEGGQLPVVAFSQLDLPPPVLELTSICGQCSQLQRLKRGKEGRRKIKEEEEAGRREERRKKRRREEQSRKRNVEARVRKERSVS